MEEKGHLIPMKLLKGEKSILVTMNFNVKQDGRKKARMCVRGDLQWSIKLVSSKQDCIKNYID